MVEDLSMVGSDYNVALLVFFVPYILFEGTDATQDPLQPANKSIVPSNIILKRVAPSTWLSTIMFLWGNFTAPRIHCRWLMTLKALQQSDKDL